MNKFIQRLLLLLTLSVVLVNCAKKTFEEYYARPASLEPPIYNQLETRGNFKNFLLLVDKAGYKNTLSNSGYWTIFAPTDSAFAADTEFAGFIKERGFSSVASVDSTTAQMIVQYLLVYNAFDKTHIDDYQSNLGWVPDLAYKRRTAYYTGFYNDTDYTRKPVKAIASNRNNTSTNTGYYVLADNNNKYIPYFTDLNFLQPKDCLSPTILIFIPVQLSMVLISPMQK
jgi:hypothetical protein